jgi:hypothetical protein
VANGSLSENVEVDKNKLMGKEIMHYIEQYDI